MSSFDLEAIKRRVAELSGVKKTSAVQLWKPALGEYKVRCLPWKTSVEGSPFVERYFYYIGDNAGMLAPHQFGKPDPINDLIKKLYGSGKPDDRLLAKKLSAKMRCYAPVIVRGEEDKGVQVWSFGKVVYQRLLSFFLDEDVGDILSPTEGFDLKVVISKVQGKQFNDTTVDPARRASKLHDNAETAQKWLDSVPNIDDMYRLKSTQEIESVLNSWLNGGEPVNHAGGEERPAQAAVAVTEAQSTKTDVKPNKPGKAAKPATEEKKQSLDDAFAELMADE